MSAADSSQLLKDALAHGSIEECLDRFDEAWHTGTVPCIDEVLANISRPAAPQLVIELIKIDLEQRWRQARQLNNSRAASRATASQLAADAPCDSGPRIPWRACMEHYQQLINDQLGTDIIPVELIAEEYRVRHLWGDRPTIEQYRMRFPNQDPAVIDRELRIVDKELQRRTSFRQQVAADDKPVANSGFSAALRALAVGDEIDDFRLLNELGEGAFARVFLAQQKSMQRLVALKVTERRSFESPVLCKLDHPNIVRVYDERPYGSLRLMYMQYVPGGSLRTIVDWRRQSDEEHITGRDYLRQLEIILREKGQTPTQLYDNDGVMLRGWGTTVAWLGARLNDALDHAHHAGVWHRDIKPENILLTSDGRPMLVDFNLSFGQAIVGATIEDAFGGSLAYMSPEQLRVLLGQASANAVGAASDVYSLAIVLWELLTGVRPFKEGDGRGPAAHTLASLLASRHAPLDLNQLPRSCPSGLRANLIQALSIDADQRPTAGFLARQYQLCTARALDNLLYPAEGSWSRRWSRHPLRWLVILGLVPNACVSLLNIWANGRLTTHNFDRAFFDNVEKPVVNMVAYTVGVLAAIFILGPIARGLNKQTRLKEPERRRLARRCLTAPALASTVILVLWSVTGFVFPLWNRTSEHSHVGSMDVLGFVLSQVIHGIIAATTTFAITSYVAIKAFLPRFLPAQEDLAGQAELDNHAQLFSRASGALALTPLLAVLALAFSDQFDKSVFVALALVGFVGHSFTSLLAPKIRASVASIRTALSSKHDLLQ